MKKFMILIIGLLITSSSLLAHAYTLGATYKWSLSSVGRLNLYTNISTKAVGFMYSVNNNSDSVVVRCPLNDTGVQPNQTYICLLMPNESAWVELRYLSRGASGTYAVLG